MGELRKNAGNDSPIIRKVKNMLTNPRSPSTSSSTNSSNPRQNENNGDEGAAGGNDRDLSPEEVEKLVQMQDVTGIDDLQVKYTSLRRPSEVNSMYNIFLHISVIFGGHTNRRPIVADMPRAAREQGLGLGGHRHGAHGYSAGDSEGEGAAAAAESGPVTRGAEREVCPASQEAQQGAQESGMGDLRLRLGLLLATPARHGAVQNRKHHLHGMLQYRRILLRPPRPSGWSRGPAASYWQGLVSL